MRIETAKRYLMQPDLTLGDVVERCGYSSATNFHRAFTQETGVTPGAYRRSARKGL